jgi:hypothetical protein
MKSNILSALKIVLADRLVTILLGVMIFLALAYCAYVGLSLRPSDLQVAVHYTAYGETNFYREKWYYLLSFIGFGLIVAILHSALAVKLYVLERRQLAIYFIWTSLLLLVIAWILTNAVLRVAFR